VIWYCDASALVKRYVLEEGSRWFRRQVDNHTVLISHITVVEVHAALASATVLEPFLSFPFSRLETTSTTISRGAFIEYFRLRNRLSRLLLRCFPIIHYAHTTQLS